MCRHYTPWDVSRSESEAERDGERAEDLEGERHAEEFDEDRDAEDVPAAPAGDD